MNTLSQKSGILNGVQKSHYSKKLFIMKKFFRYFFLLIYYLLLRHLPHSTTLWIGPVCEKMRYLCCRNIFNKCGKGVNIENKARFGKGFKIEIGDKSGIGINCKVPSNIKIGSNVMMGPEVIIFSANHNFQRTDIPMISQGNTECSKVIIEDDVWIGQRAIIMPGRHIRKGTIIGAGSVLTKDFPAYSIVGGNPARLIRSRISDN